MSSAKIRAQNHERKNTSAKSRTQKSRAQKSRTQQYERNNTSAKIRAQNHERNFTSAKLEILFLGNHMIEISWKLHDGNFLETI